MYLILYRKKELLVSAALVASLGVQHTLEYMGPFVSHYLCSLSVFPPCVWLGLEASPLQFQGQQEGPPYSKQIIVRSDETITVNLQITSTWHNNNDNKNDNTSKNFTC